MPGKTMRGLFLTSSVVLMLSFASSLAGAGSRVIQVDPPAEVPPGFETYKGYIYDLSDGDAILPHGADHRQRDGLHRPRTADRLL
jgi:hypothetical protein